MKQQGNLVRLLDIDDEFIIDLIYATPNNFTGKVVYDFTDCYIDINTAKRLIEAKNMAKADGYRMKVWDAFRPTDAQAKFWEILPDNNFVAYPPDMQVLKEFKNCDFGAVITSDCHNKDFIDCYYNEARELLLSAGFTTQCILTDNGFKEVKL